MSALSAGLSIREFARRDGCDDKLVRRAIEKGRLTVLPDGGLDPTLVGSGWRQTNRRADKSADKSADTIKVPAPVRALAEAALSAASDTQADDLEAFIQMVLSGKFPEIGRSEQVKESALALIRVLEARQKAGALIDLQTAEAVIFETSRAARDAWANWPSRVGPLIAADLGLEAERVTGILKAHVHQQLTDLGEPDPDFAPAED